VLGSGAPMADVDGLASPGWAAEAASNRMDNSKAALRVRKTSPNRRDVKVMVVCKAHFLLETD
jgi:hypothetical protein